MAFVTALHWLLDFVGHRSDLQLAPGINRRVGLGLWNSVPATAAFETTIFIVAFVLYLRSSRAIDWQGRVSLWVLAVALLVIYAVSLQATPPPNITVFALSSLAQWLFVVWSYWIDRHRQTVLA